MSEHRKEAVRILNDLIETCKDGQEGFRVAAENVTNKDLRKLFQLYSRQRTEFLTELQNAVRASGEYPETSGSVAGAFHRGWMNIRKAVAGKDEEAIIAEAERGEDIAVHNYQEALKQDLPADINQIVARQYVQIKEAHEHVRSLKRATQFAEP